MNECCICGSTPTAEIGGEPFCAECRALFFGEPEPQPEPTAEVEAQP